MMPRFRDLVAVNLSDVPYTQTFYAIGAVQATKMADLFKANHCGQHDNCIVHYHKGFRKGFHYQADGSEIVYIPKNNTPFGASGQD